MSSSSASASASALPTTGIYEPLLPPDYPVSKHSRGAYVLLTAVIMIVISGLTVATKLQMTLSTFRKLRRDDIALVSALVFAFGYTVAICRAVDHGLGRAASELTSSQMQLLSEYYYAANIMVWLSMASSKCAVSLLVISIQPPRRWMVTALYVMFGIAAAWGIAAAFVFAFQCGPNRYSLGPTGTDTCIDQYSAQIGVRIVDIVSDIALCLIPAVMMVYVQTSVQRRLVVSGMFAIRLATPVFSAVTLASFADFYNAPTRNRPLASVDPTIWTCVALNSSLLTACLPSIKRVLTDWAAGLSNANIMEPFELQYSSQNKSRIGQLSGTGRPNISHPRSHNVSKAEHEAAGESYAYYVREGRDNSERSDDTESKRGLTDGIVQTVDYSVEFEEDGTPHGQRSSSRRS